MRVQHNIPAMNSYRNYNNNTAAINKNLEKLSSGYKINRAGDDAAGLAISEKMRAQITGLDVAQKNAKDGISLVQTAEGALTEVHSMLNRMVELAEQSANGTYNNDVDREQLQKEIVQLRTEVNRIADSSNFNGLKLLDGSLSGKGATAAVDTINLEGAITYTKVEDPTKWEVSTTALATVIKANIDDPDAGTRFQYTVTYEENGSTQTKTFGVTAAKDENGIAYLVGDSGAEYHGAANDGTFTDAELNGAFMNEYRKAGLDDHFSVTGDFGKANALKFTAKESGSNGARLTGFTENLISNVGEVDDEKHATLTTDKTGEDSYIKDAGVTLYDGSNLSQALFSVNGKQYVIATDDTQVDGLDPNINVIFGKDAAKATSNAANVITNETGLNVTSSGANKLTFKAGTASGGSGGLKLQIGDTADKFNQMQVTIGDVHAKALGIGSIDISTQSGAATAMDQIKKAINTVSDIRGTLGATQNRLEHTINNLSVMQENMQDAESTIRDTDVANEMMKYTKNSILVQSAQAMLAQANQQPQGVLQLLQ